LVGLSEPRPGVVEQMKGVGHGSKPCSWDSTGVEKREAAAKVCNSELSLSVRVESADGVSICMHSRMLEAHP
jgi:hypothetical protein